MHSKDLPEARGEFLHMRASLHSSFSQQLITHAILLFAWGLIYIQVSLNLNLDFANIGQSIANGSTIILSGAALTFIIGRFLFYGNISNFLNSIKYEQVMLETIRNLIIQDLIRLALENWEEQWKVKKMRKYFFKIIRLFSGRVFASWQVWAASFSGGVIFLLLYLTFLWLIKA